MDKAIKLLRQLLHLGVLWVAACASLVGMLAYTKTGIETLIAEQQSPRPQKSAATSSPAAQAALTAPSVTAIAPASPSPAAGQASSAQGFFARPLAPGRQATAAPTAPQAPEAATPRLVEPPQRARRAL